MSRNGILGSADLAQPIPPNHLWHTLPKRLLLALSLLLLFWQANALAQSPAIPLSADLTASIEAALKRLDATDLDTDWHFTMEVKEDDELRLIQSDPFRDKYKKRQLLSVNGVAPSEEQREEFYDKEVERVDGEDSDDAGYASMVDVQTLQLVETGDGYVTLAFMPSVKAMEDSREKLRGILLFNMESQQIDQIDITNTEELSPLFSVTVETYRLTLTFKQAQGEQLIHTLDSHAVGKAGFVKSFESLVEITFSDYQRPAS